MRKKTAATQDCSKGMNAHCVEERKFKIHVCWTSVALRFAISALLITSMNMDSVRLQRLRRAWLISEKFMCKEFVNYFTHFIFSIF